MALLDASNTVIVDAVIYGSQQSSSSANGTITSPELATLEGDQRGGGCIVVVPAAGGRGTPTTAANKSSGRFPDGADTDNNCTDFLTQSTTTLLAPAGTGTTNIKVASVAEFSSGQTIVIDSGENLETVLIGMVGTAGATTISTAAAVGTTVVPVAGTTGFSAGQMITVDSGANSETAVVVSISGGGRGGGTSVITITTPLAYAHPAGALISGSGITLTTALKRPHASGAQIVSDVPTPGAANKYLRKRN